MSSIEKRIEVARKAILQVRKKKYKIFLSPRFRASRFSVSPEMAYGSVGVLGFIQTGDVDKILVPEIKKAVQKLLKETARKGKS